MPDESLNSKELMELFIELGARRWSTLGMDYAVRLENLEAMSMLDSKGLEAAIPFSGPPLYSYLQHEVYGLGREMWISATLKTSMNDKTLRDHVGRLLDEELRTAGVLEKYKDCFPLDKGTVVAAYRVRKLLPFKPETDNMSDIKITLKHLVGGNGGSQKETDLYFKSNATFELFQVILRDATQLSVIPPLDLLPSDLEKGSSKLLDPALSASAATNPEAIGIVPIKSWDISDWIRTQQTIGEQEHATVCSDSSPLKLPIRTLESKTSLVPLPMPAKPRTLSAGARGYTIDDGPWLYSLVCSNPKRNVVDAEIEDEPSYHAMIDRIAEAKKDASKEFSITVCHSMDKKAMDQWKTLQDKQAENDREFVDACVRAGLSRPQFVDDDNEDMFFDEGDIGVPFTEWLLKDLALAREKRLQEISKGSL